jgi:hypothetical protein
MYLFCKAFLAYCKVDICMEKTNIKKIWKPSNTGTTSTHLTDRAQELRSALRLLNPNLVAARSGVSYLEVGSVRGELHIPLWGFACILSWPDLIGYSKPAEILPNFQQALLLYYLTTADGASQAGKWVSFADLPGGRMYNQAFQGYTGDKLSKAFHLDLDVFKSACEFAGGKFIDLGNASYTFQALPRVPLMVTYWLGDEDFPSSCKILFDASATHYLPIDVCAILGSNLTQHILKHRLAPPSSKL